MKNILFAFLLLTISVHSDMVTNGVRVTKIVKSNAFSSKQISKFAKMLEETKGTKKLGKHLGKMNLKNEVLEDTFIRITIYQKKMKRREAEEMFMHLAGSKGFRTTLKKVIGNSAQKTSGHLNELRIAHSASKNGFKVRAIGEVFVDGIKKSPTDLDILLTRKGKTFAIEAKDYAPTTNIKLDSFRGDMDTLISYARKNPSEKIIPIFSMTNKPNNSLKLRQLEKTAEKRGVELIFGTPQQQVDQIKLLGEIL